MPTKKVTCTRSKLVLLTVYVERPKRRPPSSTHPYHHHPYIHHHTIKQEVIHYRHRAGGQGYISRRAELLQYSQCLRLSARSAAPASKPYYQKQSHVKTPQPAKIVAVGRKPKTSDQVPRCVKNWIFPSVFGLCTHFQAKNSKEIRKTRKKRSTTSNNIKSAIKSFQGQKKLGFFSKLFRASSKRK